MKISGLGILDWHLTGFYDCSERSKCRLSWNLLRALSQLHNLPWLCIGDYNDMLLSSEKSGGNSYPQALLEGFRQATEDCNLHDILFCDYRYTWECGGVHLAVF